MKTVGAAVGAIHELPLLAYCINHDILYNKEYG